MYVLYVLYVRDVDFYQPGGSKELISRAEREGQLLTTYKSKEEEYCSFNSCSCYSIMLMKIARELIKKSKRLESAT
jgi:hypothetical protein